MESHGDDLRGRRSNDVVLVDLLRVEGALGIGDLSAALGVTATAVRQRLDRLMRQGLVERRTLAGRRGRPAHEYTLTEAGRRSGGDNFRNLALVLWREIRGIRDADLRRGMLARIGAALADMHRADVSGAQPADRLHDVAEILRRRDITCAVEQPSGGGAPVLANYACPYADLADEDRGICAAERIMIEQLVGSPVRLSECRLDGDSCCRFTLGPTAPGNHGRDLQTSS